MSIRTLAAALFSGAAFLAPAAFADNRDFTLHNNTPWRIEAVYVALPSQQGWGNDVLGRSTLGAGSDVKIEWPDDIISFSCLYDVLVVFQGDPPVQIHWNTINVCAIDDMKVWYDFNQRTYQASWE